MAGHRIYHGGLARLRGRSTLLPVASAIARVHHGLCLPGAAARVRFHRRHDLRRRRVPESVPVQLQRGRNGRDSGVGSGRVQRGAAERTEQVYGHCGGRQPDRRLHQL
uniref:(northern house mosquito) hypothetical protein n=1 Tax=Culex pipiens TaxID=7175 RepID=A0A8D8KUI1_CULPI